jgi:N-acetylglucosamine kinase-like BadF-type ATPase
VQAARGEAWIVVNDVVAAWATATSARPGVGVIAGTGSNVFGVGPHGESWRVGGWGHLLGDEGSAYWLGLHSIIASLRARDGSGPSTRLSEAVVHFFGVTSAEQVAALTYSRPLTKRDIAAFAVETGRIAQEGDEVARDLYARVARELGKQVEVVIEKTSLLDAGDGGFEVGLIGGAFAVGALLVDPLTALVRDVAPQARISVVQMAPVGGSLMLASQACERPIERSALESLLEEGLRAQR